MIGTTDAPGSLFEFTERPRLGTIGHLAVFVWVLGWVMLVPQAWLPFFAIPCLAVLAHVFPGCLRRAFRMRWLVLLILLASPSVFLLGDLDRSLVGIAYSSTGLAIGVQIAVRFIVVLVAVGGLTGHVDITSIAGLLERLGLQGLGFSMGVALNLLPSLQASSMNAWRSLWMRGGLRRNRLRGLRLLILTIITNALRRADEITLAAETRAFTPESSRPAPVLRGSWDGPTVAAVVASWAMVVLLR